MTLDVPARFIRTDDGEFYAVTSDSAEQRADLPLTGFLQRIRRAFDMDVVFVSQFVGGKRVVRWVDADAADEYAVPQGATDPLEESYCWHVAQGRLPEVIPDTAREPLAMSIAGTAACKVAGHVAVPIVTPDGAVFGTVCCFSHEVLPQLRALEQAEALRSIAALLADAIGPPRRPAPNRAGPA
ncbi:GAF domain-containing protein [Ramlibacter albus]|uniref:GAF domain-containing protein n=1 Tax=Ramlibacter albus TaxID=2079448 RepID=A0A923M476_9BURK|nr:GAF domain-containing protein [Ramlibacter albus]MBC5763887.1 GAF domain-containing protein [Ramlibacter albus]